MSLNSPGTRDVLALARTLREIQDKPVPGATGDAGAGAGRPWSEEEFARELAHPECRLFEWRGGQGFVLSRRVFDEEWIFNIAVRDKGRGLGRELLRDYLNAIRVQDPPPRTVGLEVAGDNRAALSLYRGAGFVRAGLRAAYYANGQDAWVMSIELARGSATPA